MPNNGSNSDAVFAGLAPDQPGHGILLLVQYLEIVVYRDAAGAAESRQTRRQARGNHSGQDFQR